MGNLLNRMLLVVIATLIATSAWAEMTLSDKVSLDGNVRFRMELDGRDFSSDTGVFDYSSMRSMIGIKVQASERLLVRAKLGEARFLGTTSPNKASTAYVELHEIYLEVSSVAGSNVDFKVGRFQMWYGSKRILGTGGWNVYGPRTYDGFNIRWKLDSMTWDLFHVVTVERSSAVTPSTGDAFSAGDRRLIGLAGKFGVFQPLFVVDWDQELGGRDENNMLMTPALNVQWKKSSVSIRADVAYQTGKRNDRDVSSYLISGDLAYTLDTSRKPFIGAGIDMTSGNGASTAADEDNAFYAPNMSRHVYRGFMDYFRDVDQGLADVMFRAGFSPGSGSKLSVDFHLFNYVEEAVGPSGNYIALGNEIDVRFKTELVKGLGLDVAYCVFMPTDDYKPSGDMSSFAYLALTGTF